MSIAQAASQTGAGIMQSVLTVANTVTGAVNLVNVATQAGNIKAQAWLTNVEQSTRLEGKYDAVRIKDEVQNKIARRLLERRLAMQDSAYAKAYEEAGAYLEDAPKAEASTEQ
jgi:hypothetical protein